MFGARPKTKGLFGKPWEAPSTPGIGDGMTQPEQPMMSAIRAPAEQPKRGLGTKLFGAGWEDKAFALGGMLRGDPTAAYMMRQEKQREQDALAQAAAEQRKRAEDLADFRTKEGIKAEYRTNDTIEDFNWYQGLSEPEKRAYHQMRPQMVQIDNGDGTKTIVPYNPYGMGGAAQGGQLPTFTDEDWEAAGSNAGGNFPR